MFDDVYSLKCHLNQGEVNLEKKSYPKQIIIYFLFTDEEMNVFSDS